MSSPDTPILDLDDDLDIDLDLEGFDEALAAANAKASAKGKRGAKAARIMLVPYAPPPPKWKPVARTLRVLRQTCTCGSEHTAQQGLFLEELTLNVCGDARRFTPLASHPMTDELCALPARIEYTYEQITDCHCCFGLEDQFLRMVQLPDCAQLSLTLN